MREVRTVVTAVLGDAGREADGHHLRCYQSFFIVAVVTGMCSLRENVLNYMLMIYVLFSM